MPEMEETQELLQEILHGNITRGFPDPPSRTMKIFISSSKSDFTDERKQFHECVYPELQRYCSQRGIDLQVIDPHWKYHGDATADNSVTDNPLSANNLQTFNIHGDFIDPHEFESYLNAIDDCYRQSMSIFFICFIGQKYKPFALPTTISSETFHKIFTFATEAGFRDASLLHQWYARNTNSATDAKHTLVKSFTDTCSASIQKPESGRRLLSAIDARENQSTDVCDELQQAIKILEYGTNIALKETECAVEIQPIVSAIHNQVKKAIALCKSTDNSNKMLCIVRRFEGSNISNQLAANYFDLTPSTSPTSMSTYISPESSFGLRQLIEDLICGVDKGNIHFFSIPWSNVSERKLSTSDIGQSTSPFTLSPSTNINAPQLPNDYLNSVSEVILNHVKASIDRTLPSISAYFNYYPEIISESHSHLCNCRKYLQSFGVSQSLDTDYAPLLQVQKLMQISCGEKSVARRAPIIVVGGDGVGKSTLLSQVFTYSAEWIPEDTEIVRIVRHVGQSPSASYTSELLRSLCLHITLVFGFEMRTNINYELSSLSIWFQELLKLIETTANTVHLVIVLDDLHHLKSPQTSTILGWMPWNLPSNVHLICSVSENEDSILKLLKSRITSDNFIRLAAISNSSTILSMLQSKLRDRKRSLTSEQWQCVRQRIEENDYTVNPLSPLYAHLLATCLLNEWHSNYSCEYNQIPDNIETIVNNLLDELEQRFGQRIIEKICQYLSVIRYGFRQVELQELIASDDSITDNSASVWLAIKAKLLPLFDEYYLLGRCYIKWSHSTITVCVQKRYDLYGKRDRDVHNELAIAFTVGFSESSQSMQDELRKQRNDTFDILREMDELWYHLLMSGNINKLKCNAMLNIEFLISAAKYASVSYLRSIVELVRNQVLDFDIELLYNVLKHAVSIASRDPHQLANELLIWLKPFATITSNNASSTATGSLVTIKECSKDESSDANPLNNLIKETYLWSSSVTHPFLIPINSWLHLPLPPQVSVINCPWQTITTAVVSKSGQCLIAVNETYIHLFNLPAKTVLKSLEGHRQTITCLWLSHSGRYLVTGSEDTSVNLWKLDMKSNECNLKHRLGHHVSGVLCVAITHSEKIILSGSEIGAICVAKLSNGALLTRLEHHRGMVTCMSVNSGDDIFASGSTDGSVIVWSLEDFMVLNQMFLCKPVMHMDISMDSTFIMLSCDDNSVNIRALTTGSDVHCLKGHTANSVITSVKFADDSCRAILGTGDGKLFVYDVHSAKLIQTLSGHQEMITAIITQKDDRFLITCGGNKCIVWNFYVRKSIDALIYTGNLPNADKVQIGTQNLPATAQQQINRQSMIQYSRPPSKKLKRVDIHKEPITCLDLSRDGNFAVTGSRDSLVKLWQLSTGETHTTLTGHTGPVNCVAFAANGVFCVSGSDDQTIRVWGLTLGCIASTFKCDNKVVTVAVSGDSRRILSVDSQCIFKLWQADTGNQLVVVQKSNSNKVTLFGNIVFTISGKNDNSVRFWSIYEPDSEKNVTHTEPINCYTVTYDCQTVITGSQDMSLKVWEVLTGKITQVLVGHEESVSCVATAPFNSSMVISGSQDCNLIVWDMTTGSETFTLSGHTANVIDVKLSLDGTVALSASEDNFLMVWEIGSTGTLLTMIDMHHSFSSVAATLNANQIVVQLTNNQILPILKLHRNPAKEMVLDLPPGTPMQGDDKFSAALRSLRAGVSSVPKRVIGRGHLKREQSFDSFYWDHMNRGISVDDFRKISALSSPMGSREHLATTGIIWDGSGGDRISAISRPSRVVSKLAAPKQKMLKKQQSMFAFFPEHSSGVVGGAGIIRTQSPLVAQAVFETGMKSNIKAQQPSIVKQSIKSPPSRTQSLEEPEQCADGNAADSDSKQTERIIDSVICCVS